MRAWTIGTLEGIAGLKLVDVPEPAAPAPGEATVEMLAVGLNYVFNEHTVFKAEYRYDWANQPVFFYVDNGSYRKSNNVLGASVVVSF